MQPQRDAAEMVTGVNIVGLQRRSRRTVTIPEGCGVEAWFLWKNVEQSPFARGLRGSCRSGGPHPALRHSLFIDRKHSRTFLRDSPPRTAIPARAPDWARVIGHRVDHRDCGKRPEAVEAVPRSASTRILRTRGRNGYTPHQGMPEPSSIRWARFAGRLRKWSTLPDGQVIVTSSARSALPRPKVIGSSTDER